MKTPLKALPFLLILLALPAAFLDGRTPAAPDKLAPKYKAWLEDEVVYLITPRERQVFLDLASDRERDLFIESFWRHRDDSPETERNEFREEHFKRIAYANGHFIGSGRPGWKTDRGKIYIILGPPRSIRPYGGTDAVLPCEVWSYQGLAIPGVPNEFDLLFFQKNHIGDYVLYQPAGDGPWSLISSGKTAIGDYAEAYNTLYIIEPDLARTSISLIPNESVRSFPSLTSLALLQSLDSAAYRKIEDLWAQKFKDYKGLVEVEYSANYIDSGAQMQIIQDAAGVSFVHLAMEPKNISMAGGDQGVTTDLVLNGMLTDAQGRAAFQFEKKIPLRFSPEQFEKVRQRPFSFVEVFPVQPGDYKLSVLLKNAVSKEFASFEGKIQIPTAFPAPRLAPLFLGFNAVRLPAAPAVPKPFVVRDFQLFGQAQASYAAGDTVYIYTQVLGLRPELKAAGTLEFLLEQDGVKKASKVLALAGNPDSLNFLEVFPAAELAPGYYRAAVELRDGAGKVLDRQAKDLMISPVSSLPRPWVYGSSLLEKDGQARIDYILGLESLNLGDPAGALARLEKAHKAAPDTRDYAFDLARTLYALDQPAKALAAIQPLSALTKSDLDMAVLMGSILQKLGRDGEVVQMLSEAGTELGLSTRILNLLGESYRKLGDAKAALTAWKKSLELQPDQPDIQEKAAALEKRLPLP